jgi:transmembrane sensor
MGIKLEHADQQVQEAIGWMVLLRSGEATSEDFRAFETWRAVDPRHDKVFQQIEKASDILAPLRGAGDAGTVHRTLMAPASRRHLLGTALAIAVAGFGGFAVVRNKTDLLADERTGTGQRRSIVLADGSTLLLNARSAVDIVMTPQLRQVLLRSGQVMVAVAKEAVLRPFVVHTQYGSVNALGTQFMVRLAEGGAQVDVLESIVEIRGGNEAVLRVPAGKSAWFGRSGATLLASSPEAEAAWVNGLLEVNDQPLSKVVDALRQYNSGIIVLAPSVAGIRVSGIYKLDNIDMALDSLQQTLPLRVTRHNRYWINIDPAS